MRVVEGPDSFARSLSERTQRLAGAHLFVLALILVFTFVVYAPVLNDWFQGDDFSYLRAAQLNAPSDYLFGAFDFRNTGEPVPGLEAHYRPLYVITILTEAELFGLRAWPYHLVSVLLHLLNTALVWLIASKATRRSLVAHLSALIFAVHPTYVTAVSWISEHTVLPATAAALISLWSFMKAQEQGAKSRLWYVISWASYLTALLYHPKAMVVLIPVIAYYVLIHVNTPKDMLSPRPWLRFLPYFVVALLLVTIGLWLRDNSLLAKNSYRYGPHVYENYVDYLRIALIPDPLWRGVRLAPVALLIWGSIGLWLFKDRRTRATSVFAFLWFLTAIVPLTSFTWGAFPRELYIVGPGLALVLALFGTSLLDLVGKLRFGYVLALVALLTIMSLAALRTVKNEAAMEVHAEDARAFTRELREAYPVLPEDASVYVVGTPFGLQLFDDAILRAAVAVYYGDIRIRSVSEEEAATIERSLKPNERVFRYERR